MYGRKSHTPVDSTIRAAALDTIRTMRAAKIASEHRRAEAVRQGDNTDARTNIDEFQEWWGSVSDVSDGRCTPHPRKLETEMEPD